MNRVNIGSNFYLWTSRNGMTSVVWIVFKRLYGSYLAKAVMASANYVRIATTLVQVLIVICLVWNASCGSTDWPPGSTFLWANVNRVLCTSVLRSYLDILTQINTYAISISYFDTSHEPWQDILRYPQTYFPSEVNSVGLLLFLEMLHYYKKKW